VDAARRFDYIRPNMSFAFPSSDSSNSSETAGRDSYQELTQENFQETCQETCQRSDQETAEGPSGAANEPPAASSTEDPSPADDSDTNSAQAALDHAAETGQAAPAWDQLGLSAAALALIKKAGFSNPTPVQRETIPYALSGRDVIASAQTGSGKTASFVLPMTEKLAGREGTYGIILAPTREIAQQTQATLELFGTPRGLRSIVLIGGVDMKLDAKAIQTYPQIIVATPGRLCDHLDRGNLWLDYIEMVVLDEADRMLDMGFSDQLSRIMSEIPASRQTLLFSATFTPTVEKLARRILHDPERVAIGKTSSAATSVDQRLFWVSEDSKARALRKLLREEPGSMIVFTRSKDKATRVWRSLHSAGIYDATYIHSDRLQSHREQALAEFKQGKHRILIATDVAGRGIHVDAVAHVVNYDLPFEPEDYVHRIGRTGRAGATGKATTFATPSDRGILRRIEALIGHPIRVEGSASVPTAEAESAASERGSRPPRSGRGSEKRVSSGRRAEDSRRGPTQEKNAAPRAGVKPQLSSPATSAPATSVAETSASVNEAPSKKRRRRRGGRGRRKSGPGSAPQA
jgi:ATP-dependent RNA helicase RhlE